MNIIKGIDRIALLIAIIVAVPVCIYIIIGLTSHRTVNPEYIAEHIAWDKKYDDRIKYLEQKNPSIRLTAEDILYKKYDDRTKSDRTKYRKYRKKREKREKVLKDDAILQSILSREPTRYEYLPVWARCVVGIVGILISFVVVLFGIRGATRGIKWISLWIIAGFKDEKKPKNNP